MKRSTYILSKVLHIKMLFFLEERGQGVGGLGDYLGHSLIYLLLIMVFYANFDLKVTGSLVTKLDPQAWLKTH